MTLPAILLLATALGASPQDPPVPGAAPGQEPLPEEQTAQEEMAPVEEPVSQASSASAAEHIEAGLIAYRKRQFVRARNHFQQAADADPSSAAAAFYLAYATYKIAEPKRPFHPEKQKAAELFARAYELDPTFKPVWATR